ncbi:MAG: hypothetical protein JWO85_2168 [Candidatus Eremiobacteraeota bacterium]|nr:hypothetical protein [Candidatus Eremiobacteraeota bacterium]
MATREFKCRFGCGHVENGASKLPAHYKSMHAAAYKKYRAQKAARAAEPETGGGISETTDDAEATFLFGVNADFAASGLDAAAFGRVLTYLANRYAPAAA